MPFDALPENVVSDLVRLKVALDLISNKRRWYAGSVGHRGEERHCAVGWVLRACEWDKAAAMKLVTDYLYPSLPAKAQKEKSRGRVWSVSDYNDNNSHEAIVKVFEDAVLLAEAV
jgi:hypothetical protein